MEDDEIALLESLNEKLYEQQIVNHKLRYRVFTMETLPKIRECLLFSGIASEDLSRYDSFAAEVIDICKKYLNGGEDDVI